MAIGCRNLYCDRNTIHANLVLCLFVAEAIFLVGIVQYEKKVRGVFRVFTLNVLFCRDSVRSSVNKPVLTNQAGGLCSVGYSVI